MSAIEFNKEMNVEVKVRLIFRGNNDPVNDNGYRVRLYDKDIFNDDFLGESGLNEEGEASFVFSQQDFSKPYGLDEKPDFYFVVYNNGEEVYKSRVMSNLDLSDLKEFTMREGEVIDLGTFLIDAF